MQEVLFPFLQVFLVVVQLQHLQWFVQQAQKIVQLVFLLNPHQTHEEVVERHQVVF